MSELDIIAVTAKTQLLDISREALKLATALHNAAPAEKTGTPNNSVQYLFDISENLAKIADDCGKIK